MVLQTFMCVFLSILFYCFFFSFFFSLMPQLSIYDICCVFSQLKYLKLFFCRGFFLLFTHAQFFSKLFLDALSRGLFHFWPFFNSWVSFFNILFTIDFIDVFIFLTKKFSQLSPSLGYDLSLGFVFERKIMSGLYWTAKYFKNWERNK
jgi:hypothetical protein